MRRYTFIGLVCLISCLTACQPFVSLYTPTVNLTQATLSALTTQTPLFLEDYPRLSRDAVLLQLDFEPTFGESLAFLPYGRLPKFSLLADGRLIYTDESQPPTALIAQLTPEEASALLTFANEKFHLLQSYIETCQDQSDGTTLCVDDGSFTLLRLRQPGELLQELKIYNGFSNDPVAYDALVQKMIGYTHPNAQPYLPTQAALVFQRDERQALPPPEPFPLNPAYLPPKSLENNQWAALLSADEIKDYLASRQGEPPFATFQSGESIYQAILVPWLPGVDYSTELTAQFPPTGPEPTPAPALTSTPLLTSCPTPPDLPLPFGNLRLVYVQDGNLFVKDRDLSVPISEPSDPTALPAVQLTRSGLVDEFVLSPDGAMAYFTYHGKKGPELRAIDLFTADDYPLAEPFAPYQRLRLNTPSDDGSWLAFSLEEDANNSSLWAVQTNGAGVKSLVTVEQLKALQPDLPSHGALPYNLQWIPGTHRIIFDAYPSGDGIFIYLPEFITHGGCQFWAAAGIPAWPADLFTWGKIRRRSTDDQPPGGRGRWHQAAGFGSHLLRRRPG